MKNQIFMNAVVTFLFLPRDLMGRARGVICPPLKKKIGLGRLGRGGSCVTIHFI